jgi:cell division septum initiation protein DivIVA
VIDRQGREGDELLQAVEAADRAGAIVTDHVRSIIDAAESRAAEIEQNAKQEAEDVRRQAHASASRLLERIDAMEGQLGDLVSSLRREADQLAADLDRRG